MSITKTREVFSLPNVHYAAFSYNDGLTGFTWKGEAGCKLGAGNFDGCINLEFIDLHTLDNPSIENPELNRKGFDILLGTANPHRGVPA